MASTLLNPVLDQVQANAFPSGSCSSSASSSRSGSPAFGLTTDYESAAILARRSRSGPVLLPTAPALANTRLLRARSHRNTHPRTRSLTAISPPVTAMATLANLNLAAHGVHASQADLGLPRPEIDQLSPKVKAAVSRLPSNHPATRATRAVSRYANGEIDLADAAVPMPAPRKRITRITWRDSTPGQKLCSSLYFKQSEPASSCRPPEDVPAPTSKWHGPVPRKPRKVLEFDSSTLPTTTTSMLVALSSHGVQVETVSLRCPLIFITVRVLNVAFEKKVFVRWTLDNWQSTKDEAMTFLPGCADPASDRFYATLRLPSFDAAEVSFCVGYQSAGQEFWDNNAGSNYTVKVTQPQLTFGAKARRHYTS
eukprot:m.101950 g.101950  ORF g.101950 m.101950 type:complete len:368 (+) comp15190_c0_seq9:1303-2406(+)